MSSERTQYANSILVSQRPIDATEIVRVRLSQAKLLNDEFANFFRKYHAIKANYSSELNKLVSESQDLNQNIEHGIIGNQVLSKDELKHYNVDAIGNLSTIWNKVISEIKEEIAANHLVKSVVDKEVIHPLTGFTTKNGQWSDVREFHAKLSEVAQAIEYNQDKLEKYAAKPGQNRDKEEKFQAALDDANSHWAAEAPQVFEIFEDTDFARLEFLRDCLLRFVTAYTDSINKISQSNEKTLETILNFNPEDEITRFAKVSSETRYIPKATRKAAESPAVRQGSFSQSPSSSAGNRNVSVATTSSASTGKNGSAGKEHKKTKLRSKVGSIFGLKKKDKKKLDVNETVPESETSSINDFGQPSRSRQSRGSSFISTANRSLAHPPSGSSQPPSGASQPPSGPFQPPSGASQPQPVAKNSPALLAHPQLSNAGQQQNSFSFDQVPLQPTSRTSSANIISQGKQEAESNPGPNSNSPFNISPPKAQPSQGFSQSPPDSQQYQSSPLSTFPESPTRVDGSDLTASQIDHQQGTQVHHKAPAPPPSRKTGNFNLGNIREDSSDFQPAAITTTATQNHDLNHSQPHTNRRDIQSQLFTNLNTATPDNKRMSSFSSFGESFRQLHPQVTGSSSLGGTSLFQHSTSNHPGLNASIAEVVNAQFKDGEQISGRIIGEVALNYNNSGESLKIPTKTNLKIISSNLPDKLIPNSTFFKQIDSDEFEVLPNAVLGRTLGALKYSISSIKAPIVVLPAWRFEPHQASVMLSIKLAPDVASLLGEGESVALTNLLVSVSINGSSKSALSKPQGAFNREKSRITWKYKEPVVLNSSNEEKLVARFITDEVASESEQGAILRFTIDDSHGSKYASSGLALKYQNFNEDDPFAQESWTDVPSYKTLVAGSYSGLA